MAKLQPMQFRFGDVQHAAEVTVDSSGTFYVSILDDMASLFEAANSEQRCKLLRKRIGGSWKNIKTLVTAPVLADAERVVQRIVKAYSASNSTSSLVILYLFRHALRCARLPDGTLAPTIDGGGTWFGKAEEGSYVYHTPSYEVGFVAHVMRKTVTQRPGLDPATKYEPATADDVGPMGRKLMSFHGLSLVDRQRYEYREIPFTEEAAAFMSDVMLGICHLAIRLEEFFYDAPRVAAAIESRALPALLAPPAADKDRA